MQSCQTAAIENSSSPSEIVNSNDKGTQPEYLIHHFTYNKEADTYTCPGKGKPCKTTGKWHTKKRSEDISYQFKKIPNSRLKNTACPVKHLQGCRHDGEER